MHSTPGQRPRYLASNEAVPECTVDPGSTLSVRYCTIASEPDRLLRSIDPLKGCHTLEVPGTVPAVPGGRRFRPGLRPERPGIGGDLPILRRAGPGKRRNAPEKGALTEGIAALTAEYLLWPTFGPLRTSFGPDDPRPGRSGPVPPQGSEQIGLMVQRLPLIPPRRWPEDS